MLNPPPGFVSHKEQFRLQRCYIRIWDNEIKAKQGKVKSVLLLQGDKIFMTRIYRDLGKWGNFTKHDADCIDQINSRIKTKEIVECSQ